MQAPTIVKRTKEYLLIKVPLPAEAPVMPLPTARETPGVKATLAEKRLRKVLHESERDVAAGRVVTARNITEAMRRYGKRQWD